MWHFSAKMPHFLRSGLVQISLFIRYEYGNLSFIYRISIVYLSCIYRVSTVVDSEMIAEEQVSSH